MDRALEMPLPEGVEHLRNIPFGSGGGTSLHLEIFRPRKAWKSPAPVIVKLHGGGWRWGDRLTAVEDLLPLAASGYFCIAPQYRLTDAAIFPAQLHDVKCAIRWVRAHRKEFNLDAGRIGVWGGSSGAHLAALLALTSDRPDLEGNGGWSGESSAVHAVVDFFGPSDLLTMSEFPSGVRPALEHESADSCEGRLLGGAVAEQPELAKAASPLTYVTFSAPPFLIMHGDVDSIVPVEQSRRLHAALRERGVDSTFRLFEGGEHNRIGWPGSYRQEVMSFFDKHLRRKG